jgi:hypothetical protein
MLVVTEVHVSALLTQCRANHYEHIRSVTIQRYGAMHTNVFIELIL